MIRFTLSCAEGHRFDSWFQSSSAFDALQSSGHLSCAICGGTGVEKALMAPALGQSEEAAPAPAKAQEARPAPDRAAAEAALRAFRKKVEETSDYVGPSFAKEARAMHLGEVPERPIYGEARGDEARALIEDGIPVAPLPFVPRKRTN